MDYVVIERVVYDAILARIDECARGLEALMRSPAFSQN